MSEFSPKVSVIVPIYNGAADVPDLIAGLRSQTYPRDRVEYLLVDNGSGDRTFDLLQAVAQADCRFRPLCEPHIQSSYAARNLGIRSASHSILVFTDADCRPAPAWLSEMVQPFADETIGLVAGEIQALRGNHVLERYAERQETLSQKHTLAHPFCAYGQTANLAVRMAALEEVGLFRPALTTGGDADLCWRILRQTAWKLQFADRAIVQHRHRATLADLKSQWRRYGRSNRYLHDLHGVELMREPQRFHQAYTLIRWLLKEVPIATLNLFRHRSDLVDFISTPIGLICAQARAEGQRTAVLSDRSREVEWLEPRPNDFSVPKIS